MFLFRGVFKQWRGVKYNLRSRSSSERQILLNIYNLVRNVSRLRQRRFT